MTLSKEWLERRYEELDSMLYNPNIDYKGKVVISNKKKAKVVNDLGTKILVVFQENGKYQGYPEKLKKTDVELLAQRKHIDKKPYKESSETIKEIKEMIDEIKFYEKEVNENGALYEDILWDYIDKTKELLGKLRKMGVSTDKYTRRSSWLRKKRD